MGKQINLCESADKKPNVRGKGQAKKCLHSREWKKAKAQKRAKFQACPKNSIQSEQLELSYQTSFKSLLNENKQS